MRYKKPLTDIFSDLIAGLSFPVTIIKKTQTDATTWVLNVDDAYFAQKLFTVVIGGKNYVIDSVAPHCWGDQLTVIGVDPITATSFDMYRPYFFYGTLTDGGIQLAQESNASDKTPMVFLRVDDTLIETFHNDPENAHERDSKCKLYYLSQGNDALLNPEALTVNVEPMKRLSEIINQAIIDAYGIFETDQQSYDLKLYAKFGVYTSEGQKKKVWTDELSGCGVDVSFTILRDQNAQEGNCC